MNLYNIHYALFLIDGLILVNNHPSEKRLNQFPPERCYRVPEGVLIPLTSTALFAYIRLTLDRYWTKESEDKFKWVINPATLHGTGPFAYAIVRMDRYMEVVQGYYCMEQRKLQYNRELMELTDGTVYATAHSLAEPNVDQIAQGSVLAGKSVAEAYRIFNTAYPMGNTYTMFASAGIDAMFSKEDFVQFAELNADNDAMCEAVFELLKGINGKSHHAKMDKDFVAQGHYTTDPTKTELEYQVLEAKRIKADKARAVRAANKARRASLEAESKTTPTKTPPTPVKPRRRAVRKSKD